jgi:hypothetical protein
MSGQYSLKTFLRQVRGTLLNRCLRRHGIGLDLDLEIIKPSVVDTMFGRLMSLPPGQLRLVEGDWTTISELASAAGTDALLREARRRGLDFSDIFLQARNGHERACWAFLEHPDAFAVAAQFEEMDAFGDGRWNRRYIGRNITPATGAAALDRLATMMRRSFAPEGRGRHCHIDHYVRQEPVRHCFFAFPEDHPSTDLAYTEAGELHRHARRSAFEVIFVYRPAEGVLEVLAPGGAERVEDLAACFASAILDLPALPPRVVPKVYELSRLKSPDLAFPTDPRDGIERVELREVRLNLGCRRGWKRRVSFASDDRAQERDSIHDMILDTINADGVRLNEVVVSAARFRIVFTAVDNQRPKRLTFTVTGPDCCTLRDNHHDQIARRCLRSWGLIVDGVSAKVRA